MIELEKAEIWARKAEKYMSADNDEDRADVAASISMTWVKIARELLHREEVEIKRAEYHAAQRAEEMRMKMRQGPGSIKVGDPQAKW